MARHISKEEKKRVIIEFRADDLYYAAKTMILEKDPAKKAALIDSVQYYADRFPGNASLVRKAAKDAVRAGKEGETPLPADAPQEKVLARQLRYALESMDSDRGEKIVALCDDGTYDTMPKELLEDDAEGEELWDDPDFTEQELGQEDDSDPEVKKKMMFAVTEALLDMALAGRGLITNRYALWDQAHDNRKTKPRIWREVMAILDEEEVRSAVDSTGMETLKDYLQHCAPRTLAMFFHTLADLVKDENLAERIRKAFPPLTTKHTLQEEENIRTYEAKKMYVEQYSIEQIIAMEIEEHDVLFANAEAHELTLSEHLRFFVMQKTKMNEGGKFDSFPELEDDASSD